MLRKTPLVLDEEQTQIRVLHISGLSVWIFIYFDENSLSLTNFIWRKVNYLKREKIQIDRLLSECGLCGSETRLISEKKTSKSVRVCLNRFYESLKNL